MPRHPLGTSGLVVPAVGWSASVLAQPSNLVTPAALVRAALDAEIDLFDAAPEGDTQDTLARALRSERRRVTLGARCVAETGPAAFSPPDRQWRPEEVRRRLEMAMRQLQTDWLDLWLLHRPPTEALEDDDLWTRLAEDRQAGWVRAVGVAVAADEEAQAALARAGALDALVIPVRLTEAEAGSGRELAAAGAERAVAVLADDPLGGDGPAGTSRLVEGLVHPDTERTPAQAVLAGVLSFPGITGVLSPAATPEELGEHATAAALPLSDAETTMVAARLDEARESQSEP